MTRFPTRPAKRRPSGWRRSTSAPGHLMDPKATLTGSGGHRIPERIQLRYRRRAVGVQERAVAATAGQHAGGDSVSLAAVLGQ